MILAILGGSYMMAGCGLCISVFGVEAELSVQGKASPLYLCCGVEIFWCLVSVVIEKQGGVVNWIQFVVPTVSLHAHTESHYGFFVFLHTQKKNQKWFYRWSRPLLLLGSCNCGTNSIHSGSRPCSTVGISQLYCGQHCIQTIYSSYILYLYSCLQLHKASLYKFCLLVIEYSYNAYWKFKYSI